MMEEDIKYITVPGWMYWGLLALMLILITLIAASSANADEFSHEININSTGNSSVHIVINVTEEPITNQYYSVNNINKDKNTKYLADAFDFTDKFVSLSDYQIDLRNKIWNYILAKLYPYFTYVNSELASCKQYNIDNEERIFDLQKRVNELEQNK